MMVNIRNFWDVEDAFFGALLGAFMGTLIDKLSLTHTILFIFFVILFPLSIRKALAISNHVFVLVIILSILWMSIYVYELSSSLITNLDKGITLLVLFIGWLISIIIRSIKK
jgi:TRAP-type C4-dicarboxylate transport system permease small subunit